MKKDNWFWMWVCVAAVCLVVSLSNLIDIARCENITTLHYFFALVNFGLATYWWIVLAAMLSGDDNNKGGI